MFMVYDERAHTARIRASIQCRWLRERVCLSNHIVRKDAAIDRPDTHWVSSEPSELVEQVWVCNDFSVGLRYSGAGSHLLHIKQLRLVIRDLKATDEFQQRPSFIR